MALDTTSPRSRRALLAAALGAGAATVASAIGRPLPARAANGDSTILGASNDATATTVIKNSTPNELAFWGIALAADAGTGVGVRGDSPAQYGRGVWGNAHYGTGVSGTSQVGHGVEGLSSSGAGVRGESDESYGVYGVTSGRVGVYGVSTAIDAPAPPAPPAKTGVYGYADHKDAASRGVVGRSPGGAGVKGETTTGTAGLFTTPKPGALHTGYALRTVGRVRHDRCVGLATIQKGSRSVVVTPGIEIVSTSAVVATLQGGAGGAVVERVAVNATSNTFTIVLTKATTANVRAAWHVFG